jgi:hypothetical protein
MEESSWSPMPLGKNHRQGNETYIKIHTDQQVEHDQFGSRTISNVPKKSMS